MKITQVGTTGATGTRRTDKTEKGKGGAFAGHLKKYLSDGGPEDDVGALDSTSALANVNAILMVQSVDGDEEAGKQARRRTIQRGEEILDQLETVRRDLLSGAIPKERLANLAQITRSRREQGVDPLLAAILDEIELRAEVELAKLTRS
ncbi:MAG: flagellar assembly protein FliX [Alphaproteobacteria bacterium]|nr:flagellar assembly protein FliX [Alphaproteobacteria bacterium]MBF0129961.1 flagellar assembly protein FliX [Alphaproteobacteria bacterium]